MKPLTEARATLLSHIEKIIGSNCYNGNIQNFGPRGVYYGEGRTFRYPLTTIDENGEKTKFGSRAWGISPEQLSTGYYAFGANRLSIIAALDEVLRYLEQNHGLNLEDEGRPDD